MADQTPKVLSDKGRAVLSGRADAVGRTAEEIDDGLLLLEIKAKMPDLSQADLLKVFMSLRLSYGEDARAALADGAVQIEPREPQ